MRKQVRDQIVELLSTVGDGVREAASLPPQAAKSVLADCCQAVQTVVKVLQNGLSQEDFSKYETSVASLKTCLEEINEDVAQGALRADGVKKVKFLLKKLRKWLLREMEVKLEIVFLPYKAAMWDSLESIYLAAREDGNCDAYVVPIPYFAKNPDGSFGRMQYEGDQFPAGIPITSWQAYSLAEKRPDVICMHNGYDGWNYVTSIHTAFYAEKIKQYTERLVYIPYFVLGDIKSGDAEVVEKIKHFCFMPGILFADQVIVQSEEIRQIYIDEFQKAAWENGLPAQFTDRKRLEKKFLGLGSPKFDRVARTKREETEMPPEWLKYIIRTDGTGKKSILYNNSIAALLEHGEAMLEKMKVIFRIFKEAKEEVTLWWRPHPLLEDTIKSMRPALWTEYQKLVQRYREEDWGIYDDTADLDRAIVWTDAYYGDLSSLVWLYRQTGKPVMVAELREDEVEVPGKLESQRTGNSNIQ